MPVSEPTGYAPEIELILGRQSKIVEAKLFEAHTDRERIEITENFLTYRL
jgi:hypothetical protein